MSQAHDPPCQSSGASWTDDYSRQTDKCQIPSNDCRTRNAVPECAVCLQQCIHPARLPCNHVFCYLCVKGVANQSKRCPMCRQEIPADFLEHPQLLELDQSQQPEITPAADADDAVTEESQWFYEGRNGWWQYDQRTNVELETAYKQGKQTCELLIAGFLYIADFTTMFQVRRNDHSRRRRIKRDLYNAPKKGIAGLRLNNTTACDLGSEQQPQIAIQTVNSNDDGQNSTINVLMPTSTGENNTLTAGTESTATTTVAAIGHPERSRQANTLHQVLEQMRSVVLRGNFPPIDEQNSNDNGSILDYSSLSWSHQTSSNTINTSDEEQT